MREAQIILPKGNDIAAQTALGALIDAFGGATVAAAKGYWRDAGGSLIAEDVQTVTVGIAPSVIADETLRNIARRYGRDATQHAVYLRLPSGEAEIINTAHLWQQKAA